MDLETYNLMGIVWKGKLTSYEGKEKLGEYQLENKRYSDHCPYVFDENGFLIEEQKLDKEENFPS